MTASWKPKRYTEDFSNKIGSLIRNKLAAGKAKTIEPLEEAPGSSKASNVIDLAELLRRSMRERRGPSKATRTTRKSTSGRRVPRAASGRVSAA